MTETHARFAHLHPGSIRWLATLQGALKGGLIDERGSTNSLQHVVALSVLAWLVGVVTYSLIGQALAHVVERSSIRP